MSLDLVLAQREKLLTKGWCKGQSLTENSSAVISSSHVAVDFERGDIVDDAVTSVDL